MRPADKRRAVTRAVDADAREAEALALRIHALAEPPMQEVGSAAAVEEFLTARGFRVERPYPHMPTALRAWAGRGRPVIGVLAEYDALPDCGPRPGAWGHGCGHNLLGAAAAGAAAAAARLLKERGLSGTVVCYGCPAEETVVGKPYMARAGAFAELDACLAWHPHSEPSVHLHGGNAVDSLVFEFSGRTAHAALAPEAGRSALDAAILTDVAANYLREHLPESVRLHSVLPAGGTAPNVVPEYAKLWYYIRAATRGEVDAVHERLVACARAGAMATETRMRKRVLTAVYHRLPNVTLGKALLENLRLFGPQRATTRDRRRVRDLGLDQGFDLSIRDEFPPQQRASSDEDNVSWLAPFIRLNMPIVAKGTPAHHRLYAAQCVHPFALRGARQTAKILAGLALDLATDAKLLRAARAEFRRATRGFTYDPLLPARQRPPVRMG